jgi:anti-anti-sigma factor
MDAMQGIELFTVRENDEIVIRVNGELDLATTPKLIQAIESACDSVVSACMLDFSQVTFIDSETIKLILRAQRYAVGKNVILHISKCSTQVTKIIKLLGLEAKLFGLTHQFDPSHSI